MMIFNTLICFAFVFLWNLTVALGSPSRERRDAISWRHILPSSQHCGLYGEKLRESVQDKIINGEPTTIEENPWHVALLRFEKPNFRYWCGGTIISSRHVVTSAHCFFEKSGLPISPQSFHLIHGKTSIAATYNTIEISQGYLHDAYTREKKDHDIALLLIKGSFNWTATTYPICLPSKSIILSVGRRLRISGWGTTSTASHVSETVLREASIFVEDLADCIKLFQSIPRITYAVTEKMFCASAKNRTVDTCQGDSGGPAVCFMASRGQAVLCGITSWGAGCGSGYPGIYTSTRNYVDWILAKLEFSLLNENLTVAAPTPTTELKPTVTPDESAQKQKWYQILPLDCGRYQSDSSGITDKIIGGTAKAIERLPWQVAFVRIDVRALVCGGTIISTKHVISACHCFLKRKRIEGEIKSVAVSKFEYLVYAGSETISGPRSIHEIERIYLHSFYSDTTLRNDIALVVVDEPFEFSSRIYPACLPIEPADTSDSSCRVSGFGKTGFDDHNPENARLLSVDVDVVSKEDCIKSYQNIRNLSSDGMFCAGDLKEGGKDSCQGDSGGPLICDSQGRGAIYGITSFGVGCGNSKIPGVYTQVAEYRRWLISKLELSLKS